MGLKTGQNSNFQRFSSQARHFVATKFRYVMTKFLSGFVVKKFGFVATNFLLNNLFCSPNFQGHNFFVLTQIWAWAVSLEISLNVEFNHGWILSI